MKIFISFSTDDENFVTELCDHLRNDDFQHEVWLAKRIPGGHNWWTAILEQIEQCEVFVVVLTPRSTESVYCIGEINYALALNKPILPLIHKECEYPKLLSERQIQWCKITKRSNLEAAVRCHTALTALEKRMMKGEFLIPDPLPKRPSLPIPPSELPHNIDLLEVFETLNPHTGRAYKRLLQRYLTYSRYYDEDTGNLSHINLAKLIQSLKAEGLNEWLTHLQETGSSPRVVAQARSAIVWCAKLLVENGFSSTPLVALLTYDAKILENNHTTPPLRVLSPTQIQQLLDAIQLNKNVGARRKRDSAIVNLMVLYGLKRSEVISLVWENIFIEDTNLLTINSDSHKQRTIKLHSSSVYALQVWEEKHPAPEGTNPIFTRILKGGRVTNSSLTEDGIWHILREAMKVAGLALFSPEDLRRSFAKGAYSAGMRLEEIQHILGHQNLKNTADYIGVNIEPGSISIDLWGDKIMKPSK